MNTERTKTMRGWMTAMACAAMTCTSVTSADQSTTGDAPMPLSLAELRTFTDVFNLARAHYVEPLDGHELMRSAITGMVSSLDPHSQLLGPDALQTQEDTSHGRAAGIGLDVEVRDARLYVREVAPGTPAFVEGVQPGDLILSIDGRPVRGHPIPESIQALRGPPGSEVALELKSPSMPARSVDLTREYVPVSSVTSRRLDGRFGYFRISHFHLGSASDLRGAIEALRSEDDRPLEGLVLDLRNNAGGVVQSALSIADGFLDEGLVVYTRGRYPASQLEYRAQAGQWAGVPLVILVNRATASASEILAGALQDHDRATLVGETTYGKGTLQSTFRLRDGSALKLTTARYFTPSGRSIDGHGIDPDVVIGAEKFAVRKAGDTPDGDSGAYVEPGTSLADAIAAVSPETDFALGKALELLRAGDEG